MARVLVLGSTGSIGVQALSVIDDAPDLTACGLACGARVAEMAAQAAERGIVHTSAASGGGTVPFDPYLAALIDASEPDIVLNALVGAAGLRPTLAALERGIAVALANKESLVAGGDLVAAVRARTGAQLVPVDSEHSALFQLMEGVAPARVRSAILTASGGPFRGRTADEMEGVTRADALRHPTWTMGEKITIDSATLMNKGLEVIEAHWLFGLRAGQIDVLVHPQSVVHSMVEWVDGSIIAQLGVTNMQLPIQYAFSYPDRWSAPLPALDLVAAGRLEFAHPDTAAFPCLSLAYRALHSSSSAAVVLNAANEIAVPLFLEGRLSFPGIAHVIEEAMDAHAPVAVSTLDEVRDVDRHARESARRIASGLESKV